MKITGKPSLTEPFTSKNPSDADLRPVIRGKTRNRSLTRVSRVGGPVGRRSRPETPLLRWKIDDKERDKGKSVAAEEEEEEENSCRKGGRRRQKKKGAPPVSARKLATGLWRLQVPDPAPGHDKERRKRGQSGFQSGATHDGLDLPFFYNHSDRTNGTEVKDPFQKPKSSCGTKNGLLHKVEPSMQFANSAMEGATKWDPACLKTTNEARHIYNSMRRIGQQISAVSIVSALEAELELAQTRIEELEVERRSSKKKIEHFLKKLSEERTAWRSREHEKVRAFIDDVKADLNREKKNRQRLDIVNSKLVNELADVKLSGKRYLQEYQKERKARELIEEVCDELAKEIGEDKAEVEELRRESMKLRGEVDDERKMLQMAEVWREERVQMKLVDAKLALEQKYSQMNKLVADLETYLRTSNVDIDDSGRREAELLRQAAASVNIQEIREFKYEPADPDDIFSAFEDVMGEANETGGEPRSNYSPDVNENIKDGIKQHPKLYGNQNNFMEDDESGWETVSHVEDQGSSYSPEGSAASVNNNHWDGNLSGSETPATEISEVCSASSRQPKKGSSIGRMWKSGPAGETYKIFSLANGRLSNARKSNGALMSPEQGSAHGGFSSGYLSGQWSSPDSGHLQGMKKGCIEWPRSAQKHSLKSKLLEARIESQKVQLKHVLKQKM